jgi:hypothetical protein
MHALAKIIRRGPVWAALLLSFTAHAVETSAPVRFSMTGSGALSRAPAILDGGHLSLRGYLQSNDGASTAAIVQDGGRFTIMAKALAVAQVCYNDTIFRDDFDGDGF